MGLLDAFKKQEEKSDDQRPMEDWSPKPCRILGSKERDVFDTLRAAFPEYLILPKVPVFRFTRVATDLPAQVWMKKVGNFTVDFAVCNHRTEIELAVELAVDESDDYARERREAFATLMQMLRIKHTTISKRGFPESSVLRRLLVSASADLARLDKVVHDAPRQADWRFDTATHEALEAQVAPAHVRSGAYNLADLKAVNPKAKPTSVVGERPSGFLPPGVIDITQ